MAQKKKDKEKELFTVCVKVSDNGKGLTCSASCMKDGKKGDFGLLKGDNLGNAYQGMKYATGLIANLWVRQLYKDGKLSDEEFNDLMGKNKESVFDNMEDDDDEQP